MELDNRPGVALGHLESFKNRASFLLKDSLKIARLALVDVSTAELMTEDATNADEWGPTTKAMADICSVVYNSEDYLRVVQVLHRRFALNPPKHWRQIHKSLILLEYLLCRGPEDLVVEFREDKKKFEELTRFVDVHSTGSRIDWGSALQRRAKNVLHLLMDEAFYKEERRKSQKISKGISGFGSESLSRRSPKTTLDSGAMDQDYDEDSSSLLVDDEEERRDQPSKIDTRRNFRASDADISSPVSQNELRWDAFSTSSPHDHGSASGRSTTSATSEANLYEESPTSVLSVRIKSAQGTTFDLKPNESFLKSPPSEDFSPRTNPPLPPLLQKLPPPPLVAEYKYVTPQQAPPRRGSRILQRKQPGSVKSPRVIPDLIII